MNKSIACDVVDCRYNDISSGYCTLEQIKIEKNTNEVCCKSQNTDCVSFECR